jgi:hypothetical protein
MPNATPKQLCAGILAVILTPGCSADDVEASHIPAENVVRGQIVSSGQSAPPANVAVVWLALGGERDRLVAAPVASLVGEDAQEFTINLGVGPPPDEAFNLFTSATGSDALRAESCIGAIAALAPGAADVEPADITPADVVGVSLDTGVVYFARDGVPDNPNDEVTSDAARLGVTPTRGYHLYVQDAPPARRAEYNRCTAAGVCARWVGYPDDGFWWSAASAEYERCLEYTPDAETCILYYDASAGTGGGSTLTPEEQAENARCMSLVERRLSTDCQLPFAYPGNPLGFELSVTVELGTDILAEWYLGR